MPRTTKLRLRVSEELRHNLTMNLSGPLPFLPAFFLVFFAMTLRYAVVGAVVEKALGYFQHRKLSNRTNMTDTKSDKFYSLVSLAVFAFFIALTLESYRRGLVTISADVSLRGALHLVLMFLAHDTYFYWTHRWFHSARVYHVVHEAHHRSRQPSYWTSFAFHPWEAVIQAVALPLLAFGFYLEWWSVGVFLSVMTFMGFINHLGHEFYPKWWLDGIGRYFVSATHHQKHHLYYSSNFGLYFSLWDRLLGTEHHD